MPIREEVDPSRPDLKIPLNIREGGRKSLDDFIRGRRGYEKRERELADLLGTRRRSRYSRLIFVLMVLQNMKTQRTNVFRGWHVKKRVGLTPR